MMSDCIVCIKSDVCRYNDGFNEWCKGDCPHFENKNQFLKSKCRSEYKYEDVIHNEYNDEFDSII